MIFFSSSFLPFFSRGELFLFFFLFLFFQSQLGFYCKKMFEVLKLQKTLVLAFLKKKKYTIRAKWTEMHIKWPLFTRNASK